MDSVLDFLVLESLYKVSVRTQWEEGDKFCSLIDGKLWYGTIREKKPFRCVRVQKHLKGHLRPLKGPKALFAWDHFSRTGSRISSMYTQSIQITISPPVLRGPKSGFKSTSGGGPV